LLPSFLAIYGTCFVQLLQKLVRQVHACYLSNILILEKKSMELVVWLGVDF
jgi:hypothetical protein